MFKKIILGLIFFLVLADLKAQVDAFIPRATAYFKETKQVARKNKRLWGIDIYGPLLLVDPRTREVYANQPDSAGLLKKQGDIYTGILPAKVNISNTSLKWNGRNWAMVMLPVPENYHRRLNLLSHELFHRAQSSLGFSAHNPGIDHLDRKEGRIFIRLELEALKRAVKSNSDDSILLHLANALIFRKYRHSLYPGADSTENLLEINEGICEYTGLMMSRRKPDQIKANFSDRIHQFFLGKSFIRSFAYETIPVYGWLLQKRNKKWNRQINGRTDLTAFFVNSFNIQMPVDLAGKISTITEQYDGRGITMAETRREESRLQLIAEYKAQFLENPHIEIPLEKMNMSFDYLTIFPLEDKGTVYPIIRVTDNWGILDVKNGALISPDWKFITVSEPLSITGQKIGGNGWTLELKDDYMLQKDHNGNNFLVKKK